MGRGGRGPQVTTSLRSLVLRQPLHIYQGLCFSESEMYTYVLIYPCVAGEGIDEVVQAERVRLLSPMRGSLLQVNTSGSTSSVQVNNNSLGW